MLSHFWDFFIIGSERNEQYFWQYDERQELVDERIVLYFCLLWLFLTNFP
jgi:hypothetical protein